MYVSLFKLFKVGIGPSSSHTVGPINASNNFLSYLKNKKTNVKTIQINLFGSLAYTGRGHGTDMGIIAGLLGYKPSNVNIHIIEKEYKKIESNNFINLPTLNKSIYFDIKKNIKFCKEFKENFKYSNAIEFIATDNDNNDGNDNTSISTSRGQVCASCCLCSHSAISM